MVSYLAEQGEPEGGLLLYRKPFGETGGLASNIQEGNRKSVVQEANRWAPVFSQSV